MSPPLRLQVPASKSITHRALLLGALSSVPCRIRQPLLGADCRSTLAVLQGMGAAFECVDGDIRFRPIPDLHPGDEILDCGNAGTTLRLLLGQAARLAGSSTFTGDASLRSRPNGPLLAALESLGARVWSEGGRAPITLHGPIRAGQLQMPASVSSQYSSSLLLALALVEGQSTLRLPFPVASRPYLDLTRQVAGAFGLALLLVEDERGLCFSIEGGQRPALDQYRVEGDWSAAAFPLVGAALAGRPIQLSGLREESRQGDRRVVELIRRFGPQLHWEDDLLLLEPAPPQAAVDLDLGPTPDLFPALCALAACAEGRTRLHGAPGLRHKECDRIRAMAEGLGRMGIRVEELPDGLVVEGGRPLGASIRSHGDHRIHMAFSLLDLVSDGPVQVDGRGCEAVSYPEFHSHLQRLRG